MYKYLCSPKLLVQDTAASDGYMERIFRLALTLFDKRQGSAQDGSTETRRPLDSVQVCPTTVVKTAAASIGTFRVSTRYYCPWYCFVDKSTF